MTLHAFSFPTAITFGAGARREVAGHLRTLGLQRPLIVTDRGVANLPITTEFDRGLGGHDLRTATFAGVRGNPRAGQVSAGRDSASCPSRSFSTLSTALSTDSWTMARIWFAEPFSAS